MRNDAIHGYALALLAALLQGCETGDGSVDGDTLSADEAAFSALGEDGTVHPMLELDGVTMVRDEAVLALYRLDAEGEPEPLDGMQPVRATVLPTR